MFNYNNFIIAENLSLNLENPEVLNDVPKLDISLTEVISQMSNEPIAGPSGVQKDASDLIVETIRLLPKAPPRASSNRKRTKKFAILTDTIKKEYNVRKFKNKKMSAKDQNIKNKGEDKGKGKGKGNGNGKLKKGEKVKKQVLNESIDSHAEDEYFCIVCGITYNKDISGGEWIQCIFCKEWAQAGCIKGDLTSITCANCNSEDEHE